MKLKMSSWRLTDEGNTIILNKRKQKSIFLSYPQFCSLYDKHPMYWKEEGTNLPNVNEPFANQV